MVEGKFVAKRNASTALEEPEELVESPKRTRHDYFPTRDWPMERQVQFERYKEANSTERRKLWSSWDDDLRRNAFKNISTHLRQEMKKLREELPSFSQATSTPSTPIPATTAHEEVSHCWTEGERIGESKTPGPVHKHKPQPTI